MRKGRVNKVEFFQINVGKGKSLIFVFVLCYIALFKNVSYKI